MRGLDRGGAVGGGTVEAMERKVPTGSGGAVGGGGSGGTCSIVGGTGALGSSSFMAGSGKRNRRTGERKVKRGRWMQFVQHDGGTELPIRGSPTEQRPTIGAWQQKRWEGRCHSRQAQAGDEVSPPQTAGLSLWGSKESPERAKKGWIGISAAR